MLNKKNFRVFFSCKTIYKIFPILRKTASETPMVAIQHQRLPHETMNFTFDSSLPSRKLQECLTFAQFSTSLGCPFTSRAQVLFAAFLLVLAVQSASAQGTGAACRAITSDSTQSQIIRLVANDSAVFALGRGTAYRVENNRLVPFTLPNQQYLTMYATRSYHFAISDSNLWRSQNGREWARVGMLPSGVRFSGIIASENEKLHYAATSKGIYQSSDSGRTWQSAWLSSTSVLHFTIVADTIYAYGFGPCCPLQRSTDGGKTWKEERLLQSPSLSQYVYKFVSFLNGIYALIGLGNMFGEIHRFDSSKDMLAPNALTILGNRFRYGLSSLTVRKGEMLCGVLKEPEIKSIVLRSTDGQRWDSLTSKGLDSIRFIEDIAANSRAIFVTGNNGMSLYTLDAPATTVAVRETTPLTHHRGASAPIPRASA